MTKPKKEEGANLEDNAAAGVALTEAEQADARHDGAVEAAKEAGKDAYKYMTDGNLPGDPPTRQWFGADDIMQWEPLLHLGVSAFEERVAEDHVSPVPEEKVVGLLRLERNGQNRTPYVKACMERLGITAEELYQVAPGGPDYTNDISPITKL